MQEIDYTKVKERIVEQAYASVNQVLNEEQTRKLIQDKFERAKAIYEARLACPLWHTDRQSSAVKCDRERDPAGHLKHPAINEGGDGDDKSVAITQMCKNRSY